MASMKLALFAVFALSSHHFVLTKAGIFLGTPPHELTQRIGEDDIRMSLLSKIESSLPDPLGSGNASSRYSDMESTLRPIYAALPKNGYGNLDHALARYALHRLFVSLHGWVIKGLSPSGGKYNASSPAGVLQDQISSYVGDLFEQHLGGKGFKLHDLAVLAATIKHLIQEEAVSRLASAFKLHHTLLSGLPDKDEDDIKQMLDTYMTGYILSVNLTQMTSNDAQNLRSQIEWAFPYWSEAQKFVYAILKNVSETENTALFRTYASKYDFKALVKVAEAVGEQFGNFMQDVVCQQQKEKLMKLEFHGTGRIKLSDFYQPALGGDWQFSESVGYLRELGVLEETDPREPSVMIANYLVAPNNCIASSGFYSACCKNECEGLLAHLEEKVAAPEAMPDTIAALVVDLPSSTVSAPRTLSASSLRHLQEMASSNGGTVRLHGRLFAQWMHHAYPRECPYPHLSGTTSPKSPEEWEAAGSDTAASEEEMLQYIQWSTNTNANHVIVEDLMPPWSSEEELLIIRPFAGGLELSVEATTNTSPMKRTIMLFITAFSLAYALIEAMKMTTSFGSAGAPAKFVI